MACPSFEHLLVVCLSNLVMGVIQTITNDFLLFSHLIRLSNIAAMTELTSSLIINISATSIIALKAWCVHIHGIFGKHLLTEL
jgi:hypothetical protein